MSETAELEQGVDQVEFIRPQPGPQTAFLSTDADIAIYGGQAGGGKTWALVAEAGRWIDNPRYGAVIFRREGTQITSEGGPWNESMQLYPLLGGKPRQHRLRWTFESGARVSFRHLQYEKDVLGLQGAQIAVLGFDELTHFTENQFWYLLSRNRTTCGIRPYVRATTNPVPADDPVGGWVNRLIAWWIDQETGLAIPERSGVIRWFVRRHGELVWADTRQELIERFERKELAPDDRRRLPRPKSLTFIPARLEDNPILEDKDPDYRANLEALPDVDRERLLGGNWNARSQAGIFFKVGRIQIVDALPNGLRFCRGWDLAATEGAGDWTVGAKIGRDADGFFYIADIVRGQWESNYRDSRIRQTAELDGRCRQRLPEDPAAAGKSEAARMVRMLAGHDVIKVNVRGDKLQRATGLASQMNAGNVRMLRAEWNQGLLSRLDAFPTKGVPDDEIDALADAFNELHSKTGRIVIGVPEAPEERAPHEQYNPLIVREEPQGPPKPELTNEERAKIDRKRIVI